MSPSCIYAEYFGLQKEPFGLTPDPEFFFMSQSHASALEWITYSIEQRELGLVVGDVGAGKTVISRCLVDSLPSDKYRIAWIINPQLTPSGMLKEIYRALFNKKPPFFKRDVLNRLQDGIVQLMAEDVYPLVIIDEAQSIPSKAVFEELRLLSNFQTDTENLLSIIFIGQPELEKRLRRKAYLPLLQRVRFTSRLKALGSGEVLPYLNHRLKIAGLQKDSPFPEESAARIFELSKGKPRPINHLASFSLMQAMSHDEAKVSVAHVNAASQSIMYLESNA